MSLIQTCKCEECDMQKSFANHWVMLYEKNGNLVILPKWDAKMMRRTRHFCGRAHASRYVERWIAGLALNATPDAVPRPCTRKNPPHLNSRSKSSPTKKTRQPPSNLPQDIDESGLLPLRRRRNFSQRATLIFAA